MKYALLAAAALANTVSAQGQPWAQCGGIGFSGPTTCVSGYTCTVSNPYYSQCIPGTGGSTGPTTTVGGSSPTTSATSPPGTTVPPSAGNPFAGVALYANPYYASEISTSAIPSLSGPMATKAAAVANVPTFVWL
jgi:cellulose 1,4-beta-cellobiosidase